MQSPLVYQYPTTLAVYHGKAMTSKELAAHYGMTSSTLRKKIKCFLNIGKRHLLLPFEITTVIENLGDFRNDPLTASHLTTLRPSQSRN